MKVSTHVRGLPPSTSISDLISQKSTNNMLSKAPHNQRSPQHVASPGSGPRRASDSSGSHESPRSNSGGHNRANRSPMASKGHGSHNQLKGPMAAANQHGPRSPSSNDSTGAHKKPLSTRLTEANQVALPVSSHTPLQWPAGAKLHSLTQSSVRNTGPLPPRPGHPRGSCRSGFKRPLHQSRGQRSPQTRLNGVKSSLKPVVLIQKISKV